MGKWDGGGIWSMDQRELSGLERVPSRNGPDGKIDQVTTIRVEWVKGEDESYK